MKSEMRKPSLMKLGLGSAIEITDLHRSTFAAKEPWHTIFAAPGVNALIEEMLADPEQYFLGARLGSALVGYAQVRIIESGPHLNNISVSPEQQRGGVGYALFRKVMDTSIAQGYSHMMSSL